MPSIAGVCNAAMVLSDKLFLDMDVDTLNETFKPKVDGTKHLDELFVEDSLDFFILFSSLASVVGNGGQSNYHAANLFMRGLAAKRRAKKLAASVINVGMVVDAGYVVRAGRRVEDHLRNLFYIPLSESDVHHLFAEAVLAGHPDSDDQWEITMGIEPFEDHPGATVRPPWYSNPRFAHLKLPERVHEGQQQSAGSNVHVKRRLEEATSVETAQVILQDLFSSKLESMLQLLPGSIDFNVPLLDLGCDSLLAVEIRTWFLKEVYVEIPVLKLLSGDSITEICRDAAGQYRISRSAKEESTPRSPNRSDVDPEVTSEQETAVSSGVEAEINDSPRSPDPLSNSAGTAVEDIPSRLSDDSTTVDSIITENPGVKEGLLAKNPLESMNFSDPSHSEEMTITRVEKMSYAQSRIWFLTELLEDPTTYNITVCYNINGNLDVARFRRAFSTVIAHHDSFRTCFYADGVTGEPMQGTLRSASATLEHISTCNQDDIHHEFQTLRDHQWDLAKGQTFSATLMSRAPDRHAIVFGYHHIIMDGVSWYIFLRDLKLAYEMKPLKSVRKQYMDFSVEQIRAVERGDFDDQVKFWKDQHAELPEVMHLLSIASVQERKQMKTFESYTISRDTGRDLVARIKSASRALRVTPFHFYLAAIQVLLSKFLDIEDLCIGVADANRTDDSIAETMGFFLNLLPMKFQVGKRNTFSGLAKQTVETVFEALKRSSVPFDLMLEKLKVPRNSSHNPLFQVAVNHRMGAMMEILLADCQMVLDSVEDAKNVYDIAFGITESPAGSCLLQTTFQSYLYSVEDGNLVMDAYIHLLEKLSSDTSVRLQDCNLYDPSQACQAISLGIGPRVEYDWPDTLSAQVDSVFQTNGDFVAIKDQHGEMTYSQLAAQIEVLAVSIIDLKPPRESRIAVLCQPTADLIVCMLAILRTGNIYVPLDLSLPQARHAAMLEICEPYAILCHQETLKQASALSLTGVHIFNISHPSKLRPHNRKVQKLPKVQDIAQPTSPAFLLYTSGSTGVPKGILLNQAGSANYMAAKSSELSLKREVVLQQSSFGFDLSVMQTFCALVNGGTLVIVPQEKRGDPVEIAKLMLKELVTFTIATPSEYLILIKFGFEHLMQYSSWRHACMAGEVVTDHLIRQFSRFGRQIPKLTNCYGPTETSLSVSFGEVAVTSQEMGDCRKYVTVGKPFPNCSIYIVDKECNSLPVGFPREICIGGACVGLGYWKLPKLTESSFVPDRFAAARDIAKGWTKMFKTEDRGRLLADGSLIFMGRKDGDTQVKLRGIRIELEEVAHTILQSAPEIISEAVITVRGDPQVLIAHVVLESGKYMSDMDLQTLARDLPLPQYMRPARIVVLEHLPLNSNGKLDRKILESMPLPASDEKMAQPHEMLTLPEEELRLLWEDVLQQATTRPRLDRDSDFFMFGGNSLLLVKLQGAVKEVLGVPVSVMEMYQASTLGRMAGLIHSKHNQRPPQDQIDWDQETVYSESTGLISDASKEWTGVKSFDREILMTGAETFLGSEILQSLLGNSTIKRIHCIAVSSQFSNALSDSDKIILHQGSLQDPTLGLSRDDFLTLQSRIDLIIHAGAHGHCLNNYSSLRVPNLHSTRFLTILAIPRLIPIHFLSSNRVTLLSGSTSLPPISVASYSPPGDGSEGYTASKWASERFLENVAAATPGLDICIHRPCAVTGDRAPSEDALNALLRYSKLMRTVPLFDHVDGFFDFRDVADVANEIATQVCSADPPTTAVVISSLPHFSHHSSGVKVPVRAFRAHMEQIHGGPFREVEMAEWIRGARELGIEALITTYLEAIVQRKERISFPFLGTGVQEKEEEEGMM